jgi:hypothetical protein
MRIRLYAFCCAQGKKVSGFIEKNGDGVVNPDGSGTRAMV